MKQIVVTADDPSVSYGPRGVAVDPESGYMFVTGGRSDNNNNILHVVYFPGNNARCVV